MSESRSQATPARDELAEAIKGYGKSFLGECEEVDVAKIEHSFDCMADGLADYLTEDAGWSKPRTVNSAAEMAAEPDGTVLRDEDGMVGVIASDPDGSGFRYMLAVGDPRPYTFASWAVSPSSVLFTPGDAG